MVADLFSTPIINPAPFLLQQQIHIDRKEIGRSIDQRTSG
jgi:hypothetical protein